MLLVPYTLRRFTSRVYFNNRRACPSIDTSRNSGCALRSSVSQTARTTSLQSRSNLVSRVIVTSLTLSAASSDIRHRKCERNKQDSGSPVSAIVVTLSSLVEIHQRETK